MICKDIINHIFLFGDSVAKLSFHLTCKYYYEGYSGYVQKKDIYESDFGLRIFKTNDQEYIMYCPNKITNYFYYKNYTSLFFEHKPLEDIKYFGESYITHEIWISNIKSIAKNNNKGVIAWFLEMKGFKHYKLAKQVFLTGRIDKVKLINGRILLDVFHYFGYNDADLSHISAKFWQDLYYHNNFSHILIFLKAPFDLFKEFTFLESHYRYYSNNICISPFACDIKQKLKLIWTNTNIFSYHHLIESVTKCYIKSVLEAYAESNLICSSHLKYALERFSDLLAIEFMANDLTLKGFKISILKMLKIAITNVNVSTKLLAFLINRLPTDLVLKTLGPEGIINDYKKLHTSPNMNVIIWLNTEFNTRIGVTSNDNTISLHPGVANYIIAARFGPVTVNKKRKRD